MADLNAALEAFLADQLSFDSLLNEVERACREAPGQAPAFLKAAEALRDTGSAYLREVLGPIDAGKPDHFFDLYVGDGKRYSGTWCYRGREVVEGLLDAKPTDCALTLKCGSAAA